LIRFFNPAVVLQKNILLSLQTKEKSRQTVLFISSNDKN